MPLVGKMMLKNSSQQPPYLRTGGAGQRSRGFDYLMDQGCAGFARQWVPGRDGDTRLCQLKPLSS